MKKTFCDRCGKEIKTNTESFIDSEDFEEALILNGESYDFCNDCSKSFVKWKAKK